MTTEPEVRSTSSRRTRSRSRRIAWGVVGLAILVGLSLGVWRWSRPAPDPDLLWSRAEQSFLAGRWDEARSLLTHVEKLRPRNGLDWLLTAQLAIAEKRFDEAISAISQIPDDHPMSAQAHLLEGRLWRQQRQLRKSEDALRKAIQLRPTLVDAHKELIYILGIQSRRHEVDEAFHDLARMTPLTHHDLFTWLLTHFTQWSPDIVQDLDGFINADPDDRFSRLAVAELLLERPGDEVDAYIERILSPLPETDADAQALRINFAFNRGRFAEAEQMLVRSSADHPRLSRIRGELELRRRNVDAAIEHFKKALSEEPYDRVAPMHLAQALKLKGDEKAAEIYLSRVQKLNRVYNQVIRIRSPQHQNQVSDLSELGHACEEAGLIEEARGWYGLAISASPLDSDAQQALARLASGSRSNAR